MDFFLNVLFSAKGKVCSSENEQITEKGKRVDSSLNYNFEGEKGSSQRIGSMVLSI